MTRTTDVYVIKRPGLGEGIIDVFSDEHLAQAALGRICYSIAHASDLPTATSTASLNSTASDSSQASKASSQASQASKGSGESSTPHIERIRIGLPVTHGKWDWSGWLGRGGHRRVDAHPSAIGPNDIEANA
jgi:hypothetical protein